ncbi:response regulator transcription factor [Sporomusa sphaeroides]|jgi:two-component system response regulator ResD|uniref:response regulator transcription factor n=1 Tax=Sporomusa sphaeroides TaxID=47679 RepID=UPI002C981951|nr:response regulator [Sporomusa sphaeroides]HML35184.1 response regulator [Sporomusa sphaeroides]
MDVTILVVDDEPAICEIVKAYLEREGFTVYTAADGAQALAMEKEHRPDLLILDIMLPKLSGLEICQSIQRPVSIIFLTANSTEADKLTAFSLGADDYITKPYSPRELVARVKAVLRRTGLLPQFSLSIPQ